MPKAMPPRTNENMLPASHQIMAPRSAQLTPATIANPITPPIPRVTNAPIRPPMTPTKSMSWQNTLAANDIVWAARAAEVILDDGASSRWAATNRPRASRCGPFMPFYWSAELPRSPHVRPQEPDCSYSAEAQHEIDQRPPPTV